LKTLTTIIGFSFTTVVAIILAPVMLFLIVRILIETKSLSKSIEHLKDPARHFTNNSHKKTT